MSKKSTKKSVRSPDATSTAPSLPSASAEMVDPTMPEPAVTKTSAARKAMKNLRKLPLSKSGAAFLLGFNLQIPSVNEVIEPLLKVCDGLSISKLILLDNSLTRVNEYDAELTGFSEESTAEGSRFSAVPDVSQAHMEKFAFLHHFELQKLQAIAASLWSGQSPLRDWYMAGVAVGAFVGLLKNDPGNTSMTSQRQERCDKACAAIRAAARRSSDPDILLNCCKRLLQLPNELEALKNVRRWWQILGLEFATTIANVCDLQASNRQTAIEERDQFIYEQITIHDKHGKELLDLVNKERDSRTWPEVGNPDKLRERAVKYAHDHNLAPPPSRPAGCPPALDE